MNITYIIGNGFDINLGLRTGYKDFYEWYVDQPSENDPDVVKNFKNEINSCLNNTTERNWSDLELALGKYSAQVSSDQFPILYMNIASGLKDFPTFTHVSYQTENQRGFSKRGDSPTTFPQQFQLL